MNAISTASSLAVLGACLALSGSAQAQIGPIPKGNVSPVGGNQAASNANQAPVCNAGPTQFLECNGQLMAVQLDGSLSYDPDGDPITFEWKITGVCNTATLSDPTSPTPILYFDPANDCIDECGAIQLRVRDPQTSAFCKMAVVVHDLLPPVLTAPLDVVEPRTSGYPAQATPATQGTAVALDCDPNPLIGYTDVYQGGPIPSGVEDIVYRTWTALDQCGNTSEDVQIIVFLAPSFFSGVPLDIIPGACNNLFQVGPGQTSFDASLLTETGFSASQVNVSSLKIRRADGLGVAVSPMGTQLLEMGTPSVQNSCSDSTADAQLDMLMTFDQNQVISALKLDQEPTNSIVVVKVSGVANGQSFNGWDIIRIENTVSPGGGPGTGTPPVKSTRKIQ